MGGAALVVGAAGYLVLLLTAPALGPAGYAQFAIFWSLMYFIVGALFGVQQEATRSTLSAAVAPSSGAAPRAVSVGAIVLGIVVIAVAASSWIWAPQLFGDDAAAIAVCVLVGTVLYAGLAVLAGSLSGRGEWSAYSWLLTSEALIRLAAVFAVILIAVDLVALAIATVAAMGVWVVALAVSSRARSAFASRADAPLAPAVLRSLGTVAGTASTAALVTGFGALVGLMAPDAPAAELGVIILVITLTRAPILMPINAYLGIAVSTFHERRDNGILRVLVKPALAVLGAGLALSVLAAWLGPWLIAVFFGEEFGAGWLVVGLSTVSATLIGVLSLTGAAALAVDRHRAYVAGWLVAVLLAVLLLAIPGSLTTRVLVALLCAPVAGVITHVALLAPSRSVRSF